MMHLSLSIISISFIFISLDVASLQNCTSDCPCDCNEIRGTLYCNDRGVLNAIVCGSLQNFRELRFSNNNLTSLQIPTDLLGCSFDFSYNQIQAVRFKRVPFSGCYDYLLDLSHNAIRRLNKYAIYFKPDDSDFQSLFIDLSHNQMEHLERNSINIPCRYSVTSEIITIDLSFNRLVSISHDVIDFSLAVLEEIHLLLNANDLHSVNVSSFVYSMAPFGHLLINLRNNSISGIQKENVEHSGFQNVSLILDENSWNCDCGQRFISFNASRLRNFLSADSSIQPICKAPSLVKMRPLLSLTEDEFRCPPRLDPNAVLDVQISEGDNLSLSCPVIGADPPVTYVEWQFSTGRSSQEHRKPSFLVRACLNCPLEIMNMSRYADGLYQCRASNGESLTISQRVTLDDVTKATTGVFTHSAQTDSLGIDKQEKHYLLMIGFLTVIVVLSGIYSTVVNLKLRKYRKRSKPSLPAKDVWISNDPPHSNRYAVTGIAEVPHEEEATYLEPDKVWIPSQNSRI